VITLTEEEADLVRHLFDHTFIPSRFYETSKGLGLKLARKDAPKEEGHVVVADRGSDRGGVGAAGGARNGRHPRNGTHER
jgi:hypothetical protein